MADQRSPCAVTVDGQEPGAALNDFEICDWAIEFSDLMMG